MANHLSDRKTDTAIYILVSLLEGPKHGYAIKIDLEKTFKINVSYGTLYGVIKRLLEKNLIEMHPQQNRRQPYALTHTGKQVVKKEIENLVEVSLIAYNRYKENRHTNSKQQ